MKHSQKRLFVPMATLPFIDFRDLNKQVELRRYGRIFTEKQVVTGRQVELRLGYSGHESIWGNIGLIVVGSLTEIFHTFDLAKIEPRFKTVDEAIADNHAMSGNAKKFIAFEVRNRRLEKR